MDWRRGKELAIQITGKYRYALIVLLIGIFLLCIPGKEPEEPIRQTQETVQQQKTLEQELEDVLSKLDGAGKVRVLLTESSGSETYYQQDEDRMEDEGGKQIRSDTVILTDSGRGQSGLVRRVDPPVYLGAVILCQGADSARVKLAVTEAVANATGLSTDRITVLKMK